MIKRIEHIGIAVKDIDKAELIYETLLGVKPYKREEVKSEKVITSFFNMDQKIELLASTDQDGVIAKFIEKKGEGIHHIAFEVENIYEEMERLKANGFTLVSDKPRPGADNKLVCFVHPKSVNGVLIELCMENKEQSL
jgi:methylmalonyl-CoA/ethylmalonyl-CoA epimerase